MNKTTASVRNRSLDSAFGGTNDRRVQRTIQALTHALVALVLEKQYNAITVQDLLDRANVGRSTFYAHYRSKDDLLLRSFEAMLRRLDASMTQEAAGRQRIAPVRELFTHVAQFRRFHGALARAHMLDRLYRVGTNQLSRSIAQRLTESTPSHDEDTVPRDISAQALAGALFAMLRWWLDNDTPYGPDRMDEIFHAIWCSEEARATAVTPGGDGIR